MGKKEQLYEKIKANKSNTTLEELVTLMVLFGFEAKRTKKGYVFKHEKLKNISMMPRLSVHRTHGKNKKVLKCYVVGCLYAIEMLSGGNQ